MRLGHWTVATSTAHPPHMNELPIKIAKAFCHKTVSLPVFGCSFDLRFVFTYTGWEGSAMDTKVYENALLDGLDIPEGKYYLADAGFPSCDQLLIPYYAVRYHLAEWGRANTRYI